MNGEEIWAESISAFSNAKGGAVIIAVSDSGKVLGVDIGKKTIENLANRIKQITDPMTYPSIYEEPG
ncbi:ATP-binding protein [Dehalococcoidia bacterium]|nr:ATP-binding protein [Dehalococcoidia bacterium]